MKIISLTMKMHYIPSIYINLKTINNACELFDGDFLTSDVRNLE